MLSSETNEIKMINETSNVNNGKTKNKKNIATADVSTHAFCWSFQKTSLWGFSTVYNTV